MLYYCDSVIHAGSINNHLRQTMAEQWPQQSLSNNNSLASTNRSSVNFKLPSNEISEARQKGGIKEGDKKINHKPFLSVTAEQGRKEGWQPLLPFS